LSLRTIVGSLLGGLGVDCALIGIFVLEGMSIAFPGIVLGGLSYYLGVTAPPRSRSRALVRAVTLGCA
jgi:hypothetical protein